MLADIRRDTVDWVPNFDGSLREPELLPAALPNLLINGSSGIAVGMATNIPPHNVGEVCQAVVLLVERWQQRQQVTVDDLMTAIKGPDFPTGGVVYRFNTNGDGPQVDAIREMYETGRGRITVQGRVEVEDIGGGKSNIIISELPFDQHGAVKKGPFIEKVAQLVREGKIPGVTDLRDESDHEGMRIAVEVSRTADGRQVLDEVLHHTQLRGTFGAMLLALVPNPDYVTDRAATEGVETSGGVETELVSKTMPRYLSLKDMLVYFVEHRLNIVVRRSRHELAEREKRLHIIEGLLIALANIDEVIAIIKKSRTQETAQANLIKRFSLSEEQARAILDMQLRRLAALERTNLEQEKKDLVQRIAYLKALLKSEARQLQVVKEETLTIHERYARPRRTLILDRERAAGVATMTELLAPRGPQVVTITTKGMIYRTPPDQANLRQAPGTTSRAVESPLLVLRCKPTDSLVLVSSRGTAWRGILARVPQQASLADLGLDPDETIAGGAIVRENAFLTLVAGSGKAKRTALADLARGEGSWNAVMGGLNGGRIVAAGVTSGQAEVLIFTRQAKAIRFREAEVNPQASGAATGVAALNLAKDDSIVGAGLIEPGGEPAGAWEAAWWVIVVSELGWLKRVRLDEFPVQGRGGGGVQLLRLTPMTGAVAAATVAAEKGSVNVLSARGKRHHVSVADIPKASRANRGEQLITFGDDDTIRAVVAFR
jgi:DNA gyrase subunit A